jgi:hypothetical protein
MKAIVNFILGVLVALFGMAVLQWFVIVTREPHER